MNIAEILHDKTKKIKEKTQSLSNGLLDGSLSVDDLIAFAKKATDSEKATCIESIEYATKSNTHFITIKVLDFVCNMLLDNAPRVKMESARVIGNIAHEFPTKLEKTIANLLINSEDSGTVVRWAASYALGEIIKLKTKYNQSLIPAAEAILAHEQDNAIKKKYLEAIKKAKK